MTSRTIPAAICLCIIIALAAVSGCSFLSGGDTSAPAQTTATAAATPSATHTLPATAATAAPAAGGTAALTTQDPWEKFVSPTLTAEGVTTKATVAGVTTQATVAAVTTEETVAATATPTAEVTLTQAPTTNPTIATVADTCSNIGGNVCLSNEVCDGAYIHTSDEAACCAGVCVPK